MNWEQLIDYLIPISIVLGALIVGYAIRSILFRYLHRLAERTTWEGDDIVIAATRGPFLIWVLMLGIFMALHASKLDLNIKLLGGRALLGLAILSFTLTIANILADLIRRSTARAQLPTPGLIPNVTRVIVIGLGVLVMLGTLDIEITPILTAFGVGGLAVALAMQDTLSNLFAGFYVTVAKQIRVGDYVKLESGLEGSVVDINWRTTTIKDLSHNLIIVPNSKLAQMTVTNYSLPELHLTTRLTVGVSFDADPERVEKILLDEAKKAMKDLDGFVSGTEPVVRFSNFGESSLDFLVIFQVREFSLQGALQSELRKRIFKRFQQERIEIPFPVRTVHLKAGQNQQT